MQTDIINTLLKSEEPSIRFRVLADVLGKDPESAEVRAIGEEIRKSDRVVKLMSERNERGEIPYHPYKKWFGAHWVLSLLADLKYPPGDESLLPLREQVLDWLLSKEHEAYIRSINGRVRRCASQEGNAVYSLCSLGIADERVDELVRRLLKWQWDDGGWNCDKRPEACNSSFMETLTPLRGLTAYHRMTGSREVEGAIIRASEVFLKRNLFKRQSDGEIIHKEFTLLHYPLYWHYDILFALKVMAEAGFINDGRCKDAIELLKSKRLPDGGFPAEKKYYKVSDKMVSGRSLVKWGPAGKTKLNEFVTVDALYVLNRVSSS